MPPLRRRAPLRYFGSGDAGTKVTGAVEKSGERRGRCSRQEQRMHRCLCVYLCQSMELSVICAAAPERIFCRTECRTLGREQSQPKACLRLVPIISQVTVCSLSCHRRRSLKRKRPLSRSSPTLPVASCSVGPHSRPYFPPVDRLPLDLVSCQLWQTVRICSWRCLFGELPFLARSLRRDCCTPPPSLPHPLLIR